ncbi:MAG: uracil-DNA glycosylase family protein [Pseudomonadota bacterium]
MTRSAAGAPSETALEALLETVRACRICEASLPLGANPVLRASGGARLMLVGQAPGTRVHATGIPWNDPSGDRLRDWLQLDRDTFYDARKIAIIPMGFCYPGKGKSGDLPPRPECAPQWHAQLLTHLPKLELVLLIGQYAQKYYLKTKAAANLTDTVRRFGECPEPYFPLPHPSPRNIGWFKRNPWFDKELVPELRRRIDTLELR